MRIKDELDDLHHVALGTLKNFMSYCNGLFIAVICGLMFRNCISWSMYCS